MSIYFSRHKYLFIIVLMMMIFSCGKEEFAGNVNRGSKPVDRFQMTIHPSHLVKWSEQVRIEEITLDKHHIIFDSLGWLRFDLFIPTAGRYQVRVTATISKEQQTVVWLEDYVNNEDERTYDITGELRFDGLSQESLSIQKDGFPLNKGLHKMKLHVNDELIIEEIAFKLLRHHKKSPKTMIQRTMGSDWQIAWSDEFDQSKIDTSNWTFDLGNWGWGNGELQYYTVQQSENARIEDESLVIEAHRVSNWNGWTSARLTTRGKVSFLYGKIEIRAKLPKYKGIWAAGSTLGDNYIDELSWPYCGEIDIMESVGYEMDNVSGNGVAHASAHSRAYDLKLANQPTATIEVGNMVNQFHLYSIVWTPEYIEAFVDDQSYLFYQKHQQESSWPFDQSQNLVLNLAIGGGREGYYGLDESIESQKMVIDYVRVYERKNDFK